jgi:hypothetical protein
VHGRALAPRRRQRDPGVATAIAAREAEPAIAVLNKQPPGALRGDA